jgi:hypothetical protein
MDENDFHSFFCFFHFKKSKNRYLKQSLNNMLYIQFRSQLKNLIE